MKTATTNALKVPAARNTHALKRFAAVCLACSSCSDRHSTHPTTPVGNAIISRRRLARRTTKFSRLRPPFDRHVAGLRGDALEPCARRRDRRQGRSRPPRRCACRRRARCRRRSSASPASQSRFRQPRLHHAERAIARFEQLRQPLRRAHMRALRRGQDRDAHGDRRLVDVLLEEQPLVRLGALERVGRQIARALREDAAAWRSTRRAAARPRTRSAARLPIGFLSQDSPASASSRHRCSCRRCGTECRAAP